MALNQSLIFPNEIIEEIAKYFSVGTLASFCCASKAWNEVSL